MVTAAITVGVRLVGSQGARLASVAREAAVRASTSLALHTPEGVKATITSGMTAGRKVLASASDRMAPIAAKVAQHVTAKTIAAGAAGNAAVDTGWKLVTGEDVTAAGIIKSAAVGGVLAPFFAALMAKRALPALGHSPLALPNANVIESSARVIG